MSTNRGRTNDIQHGSTTVNERVNECEWRANKVVRARATQTQTDAREDERGDANDGIRGGRGLVDADDMHTDGKPTIPNPPVAPSQPH
jgi:hypothetical protein